MVPIELAVRALEETVDRHAHHHDDLSHGADYFTRLREEGAALQNAPRV
jgi:hypothetical protein